VKYEEGEGDEPSSPIPSFMKIFRVRKEGQENTGI